LWKKIWTNCLTKFHIWEKTNSTKILRFFFHLKKKMKVLMIEKIEKKTQQ
jgi:hypothetical protein